MMWYALFNEEGNAIILISQIRNLRHKDTK